MATVLPAGLARIVGGMRDEEPFENGEGLQQKACWISPAVDRPETTVATFALEVFAGAFGKRHERRLEIDFLFLE